MTQINAGRAGRSPRRLDRGGAGRARGRAGLGPLTCVSLITPRGVPDPLASHRGGTACSAMRWRWRSAHDLPPGRPAGALQPGRGHRSSRAALRRGRWRRGRGLGAGAGARRPPAGSAAHRSADRSPDHARPLGRGSRRGQLALLRGDMDSDAVFSAGVICLRSLWPGASPRCSPTVRPPADKRRESEHVDQRCSAWIVIARAAAGAR